MGTIGTSLAAAGNALGITPSGGSTAALTMVVLGIFLAWHGYLVYSGQVPVRPFPGRAFSRPDIDLASGWCGAGLVAWGAGWLLSIPPSLPVDIIGQILAAPGAVIFLFGVLSYIYMPKRLRPAWAGRATVLPADVAAPAAAQPAAEQDNQDNAAEQEDPGPREDEDQAQPPADEAASAAPPAD